MLHDSIIVLIRILQILGGLLLMGFIVLLAQNNDHQVDLYLSFFSFSGLYQPTVTLSVWLLVTGVGLFSYVLGLVTVGIILWQKSVLRPYLKTLSEKK